MSKSMSGYFKGTSGEGKQLISEVKAQGYKITEEDVIGITKDAAGKIVWLEKGHTNGKPSGLAHIMESHEQNFVDNGIASSDIPDFILTAVSKGKIIGYQGKGTGRPIYEVTYKEETFKVAITVGENGYIVGANPKSK